MADKRFELDRFWRNDGTAYDDMRLSQDAANFLAVYGPTSDNVHEGLSDAWKAMPPDRPDLVEHWERFATRVAELITKGGQRPSS